MSINVHVFSFLFLIIIFFLFPITSLSVCISWFHHTDTSSCSRTGFGMCVCVCVCVVASFCVIPMRSALHIDKCKFIITINHICAGYLQLYTLGNPCFQCIWYCSHSVVNDLRHMWCYFPCWMICTFTLVLSEVSVQCPLWLCSVVPWFHVSRYVVQVSTEGLLLLLLLLSLSLSSSSWGVRKVCFSKGSQAVPARPSGKGRLETSLSVVKWRRYRVMGSGLFGKCIRKKLGWSVACVREPWYWEIVLSSEFCTGVTWRCSEAVVLEIRFLDSYAAVTNWLYTLMKKHTDLLRTLEEMRGIG